MFLNREIKVRKNEKKKKNCRVNLFCCYKFKIVAAATQFKTHYKNINASVTKEILQKHNTIYFELSAILKKKKNLLFTETSKIRRFQGFKINL